MPPLMYYQFEETSKEFRSGSLLKHCTLVLLEVPTLRSPKAEAFSKSHGMVRTLAFLQGVLSRVVYQD